MIDEALVLLEEQYAPAAWRLRVDYRSRQNFVRCLSRLDLSSSPGWPYMREAPTTGRWLKFNGLEFDPIQVERLWFDVQLVFSGEFEMYLKLFIKQEPHKRSKADVGRWRLIMASPLCVQMSWHMLFADMNDREIEVSLEIPSQQGIVLPKAGWISYMRVWASLGLTSGLDKTAWDWTFPYWAIVADLELRRRLARPESLDDLERWNNDAKLLYSQMFEHPKILMSDGTIYEQEVPGVMKSGCVNTISTNGHGQSLLHVVVCLDKGVPILPLPRSCGDDTLHHPAHVEDLETYRRYGIVVKSVSSTLEFVGHEFRSGGPVPMYLLKHLFKLPYIPDEDLSQYLDSMARMYVHSEYYSGWSYLASRLNVSLPLSREGYLRWYDWQE